MVNLDNVDKYKMQTFVQCKVLNITLAL